MSATTTLSAAIALAVAISAAACNKKEQRPEQSAESPPEAAKGAPPVSSPATEARGIFKKRCVVCHGEGGKGDGPGAAALNPKPRDYTSSEWQTNITDDELKKVIVGGGPAVGKSPVMPPNPDLRSKPEVVDGLVAIIRGFQSS